MLSVGRELAEGLAHQAGLEADLVVSHLALDLGLGRKRGHGVDDDDVDGARTDEIVRDLEGLLAIVRLRDKEGLEVDSKSLGISAVERVLGVDHGGDAALLLRFGDGVDGERGLAAGLRSVDLNDAPARITADAQGMVEGYRAARDDLHVPLRLVSQLHDRALSIIFLDLVDRRLQRLHPGGIDIRGVHLYIFCHSSILFKCYLDSGPETGHDKYINNRRVSKTFAKINRPWAKPRHKVDFIALVPSVYGRRPGLLRHNGTPWTGHI